MKKVFIFLLFFFVTFINVYAEGEYVTGIKVDDKEYSEFDASKTEYTIDVDSAKDKIKIAYLFSRDEYIGQGSEGTLTLKYGDNVFNYLLTNKSNANDKKSYKITVNRKDERSNDNSLSSLTVGGSKVVLGTGNDYTVDVSSKLTGITIEAKTNSDKASFVDGYGPRTISADSTSAEIKVKAENEEIRTYKINITKSNAKSNDTTLKTLTIDRINFDFKPSTYEYKLNASSDISKIKIKAVPNSDKASLEFKEEHELNIGENTIEIKVTAEDGTSKTYKLVITKEEKLPLITDIKIKNVDFEFDPAVYSYKLKTDLTELEFDITLSKEDIEKPEIVGNENLKDGSVIKIEVKDNDEKLTYTFEIDNEEDVQDIIEQETSQTTNTTKTDFFQKNEMIIGLAVFGIGLLSMLAAILLRPKSQIM